MKLICVVLFNGMLSARPLLDAAMRSQQPTEWANGDYKIQSNYSGTFLRSNNENLKFASNADEFELKKHETGYRIKDVYHSMHWCYAKNPTIGTNYAKCDHEENEADEWIIEPFMDYSFSDNFFTFKVNGKYCENSGDNLKCDRDSRGEKGVFRLFEWVHEQLAIAGGNYKIKSNWSGTFLTIDSQKLEFASNTRDGHKFELKEHGDGFHIKDVDESQKWCQVKNPTVGWKGAKCDESEEHEADLWKIDLWDPAGNESFFTLKVNDKYCENTEDSDNKLKCDKDAKTEKGVFLFESA